MAVITSVLPWPVFSCLNLHLDLCLLFKKVVRSVCWAITVFVFTHPNTQHWPGVAKMPLLCSSKISRQTTKLMSPLRKFHLDSVSEMNVLKLTSSLPTPVSIGVRETDLFRKLGILKKVLHSPVTDKNWHLIARMLFSKHCHTLISLWCQGANFAKVFLSYCVFF